ncbi:MAG: hypothetical protein R3C32_14655 [Chloroflexota bacterium]
MIHRHLNHRQPTLAALDDVLENGTLGDWQPVLALVRDEPDGEVAHRLDHLLAARDYQETGALWRAYLRALRAPRSSRLRGSDRLADTSDAGNG